MCDLNYVTDDARDEMSFSDDDLDSYFNKPDEERATDVSDTTDGSDSDHAYYPDLSSWQFYLGPPSDGEEGSDERLPQHWNNTFSTWIPLTAKRQKCAWPRQGPGVGSSLMVWMMILMAQRLNKPYLRTRI
jgi:hypothetical protein